MSERVRALIVEDSEARCLSIVNTLRRAGYEVAHERVETAEGLRAALDRDPWDVVISDYSMPRSAGMSALGILREREDTVPFIFVSGTTGQDVAVRAMLAGANDYVVKGSLKRLAPALDRELRDAGVRRDRSRLEAELRESQKLEAVGRLAGSVAHDFNNLLTVIMGSCQLMLTELSVDHPLCSYAHEIEKAAQGAADLTRQLVAFSRGQLLQVRTVDLHAILRGTIPLVRRVLPDSITLELGPMDGVTPVRADPGQLEQVLMNLCLNARDAMPEGGCITVGTRASGFGGTTREARSGAFALLEVSDTGMGMDDATRSRIFEPFFTTKGPGLGTGLGLATVRSLVEQAGGFVRVKSKPGMGSMFRVYLPSSDEPVDVPVAPVGPFDPRGSETILLVEDVPTVRSLMHVALERYGYQVHEAFGSLAALELARSLGGTIDLLVTDVVMPDLSGPELAERIVALSPATRVLFVSGYLDDSALRLGILESGAQFLQKPFTPDDLARKAREVMDKVAQ